MRILDLSESEVSDRSLEVIARYGGILQKLDLNAAKENRTNITSQGNSVFYGYVCLLLETVVSNRATCICILMLHESVK